MNNAMPFSFAYYREILNTALEKGFKVTSFENYDSSEPKTIILRHDVDYTLNAVADFAEIEKELGISSTYMFRVHAHEYNLFAPHVYKLLKDLRQLGHEIGLHLEASNFANALNLSPRSVLQQEKLFLETIVGEPVISASEHRDISHTIHGSPYYREIENVAEDGIKFYAMDPKYCKEMKYLSDSNGNWREGDLLQHIDDHNRFQILIHPDWWFEEHLLLKGPYFHGLGN